MNHALRSGGARENTPGSPWLVSARQKKLKFQRSKSCQPDDYTPQHSLNPETYLKQSLDGCSIKPAVIRYPDRVKSHPFRFYFR
jgi:hypothetical protein